MTEPEDLVADVIAVAGDRLVGRVRLQKMFYLLDQVGLESGFEYQYHHYGPYSADLADAVEFGKAFHLIDETAEHRAADGVPYSIFKLGGKAGVRSGSRIGQLDAEVARSALAKMQTESATVLELAATIHWLRNVESVANWRAELLRRKGVKTEGGRTERAETLLARLGLGQVRGAQQPAPP